MSNEHTKAHTDEFCKWCPLYVNFSGVCTYRNNLYQCVRDERQAREKALKAEREMALKAERKQNGRIKKNNDTGFQD